MTNPWDQRYKSADYYYGTDPNTFLMSQASLFFSGAKVLCLGEGEGRNAVALAKLGCAVTALDGSTEGLQKAQKLATENQVSIQTQWIDLREYVFEENQWDFIVSIWCHLPSALRQRVHHGVLQGLNPHGFYILEAYTPKQLLFKTGGPQDPDLLVTLEALSSELKGMKATIAQEIIRPVSEGIGHLGESAVVQWVARKS